MMSMGHRNEPCDSSANEDRSGGTVTRDDILAKAKALADMIASSNEVRQFRSAEEQIGRNERIQGLIAAIKKKQKEIVAFESLGNKAKAEQIEGELQDLQDELDGIPIVTEYQETQVELNDMLQLVVGAIRDTVSEKIHVQTGAEGLEPPATCD